MNFKNDASVHRYLNDIDSGPLLTKDQEIELVKSLEVYQKEILSAFLESKYSRIELHSYLSNLDSSGEDVVDISKVLDEESSEASKNQVRESFKMLLNVLGRPTAKETVLQHLNEVSLTGTIIHGVVIEIKKKFSKLSELESNLKQIFKYGPVGTNIDNVLQLDLMAILVSYGYSELKAQNKLNEWTQFINDYRQFVETLSKTASVVEIKETHKRISQFEFMAVKFKNELIEKNLRLVVARAKRFLNRGLEFEDLIQEGNIGLIKAIDKFDSSKKTKISTYATWWIDQSIRRAISNKGKTVRVPTHIEWMQTNLNALIQKMTGTLKRPPTLTEISVESGYSLEELRDLQTRPQHEIGIEEELSSGVSLIELLPSDSSENPHSIVEKKLLREKIRDILATLPPRTEKIIRLRFGIGELPDDEGNTLQKIADDLGSITKQGVRVVASSGLKHLKKKAKELASE